MDPRALDRALPQIAPQLRILAKGAGFVPFRLNPIQQHRLSLGLADPRRRTFDLKARQTGLSTLHLARLYLRCVSIDGFQAMTITHTDAATANQNRIMRRFHAKLPPELRQKLPEIVRQDDTFIQWSNDATWTVGTAGGVQVGRGDTLHFLHGSEFAFWPNAAAQFAAVLPAIPTSGEIALETTPNGYGEAKDLVDRIKDGDDPDWFFSFLPWFMDPDYQLPAPKSFRPTDEEAALMERHALTPEQIMFRRQKARDHPDDYLAEYAEDVDTCFIAGGDSAFGSQVIQRLRNLACPPTRTQGLLRVWAEPVEDRSYVIGADVAEGVKAGDKSAAYVAAATSGSFVAALADDPPTPNSTEGRMLPEDFARQLAELGRRYNTALICVERNGPGATVCWLLENVYHYPNLYRPTLDPEQNPDDGRTGFRTHVGNRSTIIALFRDAAASDDVRAYDSRLPAEMADFVLVDPATGKRAARRGKHDDFVMAAVLTNYARRFALPPSGQSGDIIRIYGGPPRAGLLV